MRELVLYEVILTESEEKINSHGIRPFEVQNGPCEENRFSVCYYSILLKELNDAVTKRNIRIMLRVTNKRNNPVKKESPKTHLISQEI